MGKMVGKMNRSSKVCLIFFGCVCCCACLHVCGSASRCVCNGPCLSSLIKVFWCYDTMFVYQGLDLSSNAACVKIPRSWVVALCEGCERPGGRAACFADLLTHHELLHVARCPQCVSVLWDCVQRSRRYAHMHTHMRTRACSQTHTHTNNHTHTHTHTHTHMHTHTHTHTHSVCA